MLFSLFVIFIDPPCPIFLIELGKCAFDDCPPKQEGIIRKYLKLRYRLMPFLYNQLEEAHRTGMPIFRPLMLNYQSDYNTLSIDDEFMIGTDLLAAPILHPGQTSRMLYLPPGDWVDFWTDKHITGGTEIQADAPLETIPLYVRAGAIIPMGPEMNYVDEKTGPLTLHVYPDAQGHAALSLYEDDGLTQAYTSGVFRRTNITYQSSASGSGATLEFSPSGSYRPAEHSHITFAVHKTTPAKEFRLDFENPSDGQRTLQIP